MNIIDFLRAFNLIVPDKDIVGLMWRSKGFAMSELEISKHIQNNQLKFSNSIACENEVDELVLNTNISMIGIGALNFLSSYKDYPNNLSQFASYNDFYKICIDIKQNYIVSFSDNEEDVTILSKSFSDFFDFLLIYKTWDSNLIYDYPFDKEVNTVIINKLIKNEFSIFWVKELMNDWPWE